VTVSLPTFFTIIRLVQIRVSSLLNWNWRGRTTVPLIWLNFWRTNSNAAIDITDRNRNIFDKAYASTSNARTGGKSLSFETLELEVDLLLPLTWLEAALFFACMATQDATASRSNYWNELALDRLESYTQCIQGRRFDGLFVL
jgi:hypothetical protein